MMMPAAVPQQLPVGKCFLINVWISLLKTPRLGGFQIRGSCWKAGIYSGEVTVARETHLAAVMACVSQFRTLTRGDGRSDTVVEYAQRTHSSGCVCLTLIIKESRVCGFFFFLLQHRGVKGLWCSVKDTQTWKILKGNTSKDFHQGREGRASWRASEICWIRSGVSCFWGRKNKNRRDALNLLWWTRDKLFRACSLRELWLDLFLLLKVSNSLLSHIIVRQHTFSVN